MFDGYQLPPTHFLVEDLKDTKTISEGFVSSTRSSGHHFRQLARLFGWHPLGSLMLPWKKKKRETWGITGWPKNHPNSGLGKSRNLQRGEMAHFEAEQVHKRWNHRYFFEGFPSFFSH